MSKGWRTKADVLKDLSEVNGRRTGAEHLDQHVVAGERPPPILHETPDADEMSYFFGGVVPSAAGDTGPDLDGISVMLKMVNDTDDTVDNHEPMTLYLNNVTDEIRISKLNPCAGEYVPGASRYNRNVPNHNSPKKSNMVRGKSDKTLNKSVETSSKDVIPYETEKNALPKYSNMFKSKSVKLPEGSVETNENKVTHLLENKTPNVIENAHAKLVSQKVLVNSLSNPNTLVNGHPKRKIEKSAVTDNSCNIATNPDIKEIQEKIKSTLIASTTDNSLQSKRNKNVAIATLLKMGMIPPIDQAPKLIKPDYFKNPPSAPSKEQNVENKPVNVEVSRNEEVTSKSSSKTDVNSIDQDAVSKVNGWFQNMECPKPKQLPQEPLTLKDNASSITFKKKTNSSVTSRNSATSKEDKKEPAKPRELKAFKPSSYASDLLKKYENNAQRAAPLIEDLGTRLERQLRERDEVIRQKQAVKNAG